MELIDLLELDLIADWTVLHQYARRQSRMIGSDRESPRSEWFPRAQRMWGELKKVLRNHFGGEMEVLRLPAWLHLWFCHELLYRACTGEGVSAWESWRFCEHLAYVIRESLRAFVYGGRADYVFCVEEHAASLRTLVEQHAVHVLRLPSDPDIRSLLNEVGSMHASLRDSNALIDKGNFLDVYIAGQFICDLRADVERDALWTVEKILSSPKPLTLPTADFRKAFSLAALLYDMGGLLPRWRPTAERWLLVDKILARNLLEVEDGLINSLATLMRNCLRELEEAGYLDPVTERAVREWVEETADAREIDFSLINAWFLHRLCQNVEDLQKDIIRQGVRAVLFHGIVTQTVDVDRDPAAALLVLCDQIFAQTSGVPGVGTSGAGRSNQGADGRIRPSLIDFLELEGLSVEAEGAALEPLLFRVQPETSKCWPHFVVTLRSPESLETPVHRVWIGLAQSLGRLRPSTTHQCAPRVTVRSEIPRRVLSPGFSTYDLLERALDEDRSRLAGALARFMTEARSLAKIDRVAGVESMEFRPLGRPLHREDLSLLFPELERLLEACLVRQEGRL